MEYGMYLYFLLFFLLGMLSCYVFIPREHDVAKMVKCIDNQVKLGGVAKVDLNWKKCGRTLYPVLTLDYIEE